MKISFERTGGIANIPVRAELDTTEMAPDRAKELKQLVDKAGPFDQPSDQAQAAGIVPDDLQYQVTIEHGDQTQTIAINDSSSPDELKLLFDFLGEEALKKMKQSAGS